MIGNESFFVKRRKQYLFSMDSGESFVQPPSNGCYIRAEGVGNGTVKINGIVNGLSSSETISTFDTEGVGFGTTLFTSILEIIVEGFTSLTLYPASESGEKINHDLFSEFTIIGDIYERYFSEFSGTYIAFAGLKNVKTKFLMYDGRYNLETDDNVLVHGVEYWVVDISYQHGYYSALLSTSRSNK